MKKMSTNDFRAVRKILEPKDFGLYENSSNLEMTDLIDPEIWDHVTVLSDDVAIYTTNHYGSEIRKMVGCKNFILHLISNLENIENNFVSSMLDVIDEINSVIFNLIHGFYRQCFDILRCIVDLIVSGVYFELSNEISSEGSEVKFGSACDFLDKKLSSRKLKIATPLFQQKSKNKKMGYFRELFFKLSKYAHAYRDHKNSDLWRSNGPVFDKNAFEKTLDSFYSVFISSLFLIKFMFLYFSAEFHFCEKIKFFCMEKSDNCHSLQEFSKYIFLN